MWQIGVGDTAFAEADLGENAAIRIDLRRDAGIGATDERQSLLDGAHARLMEVLVGPRAATEPRIVGEVKQPAWPLGPARDLIGKDDFVADERTRLRGAGNVEQQRSCAFA